MARFLFLLLPLWSASADAKELAGVTLPDQATVGGAPVTLNGLGLREKFYFDIYVGGLYLQHPTHDANAAISADEPKKVVMHFVYSKVTRDQLVDAWKEDLAYHPEAAAQQANVDTLLSWMPEQVTAGQEMVYEYVPGQGTTVTVAGKKMGTVAGADFMKLVWSVWLGSHPPTDALKQGMLGN